MENRELVPAVCPQCGANIELDKNLEQGFCNYCGTKIIIKDVVQKVKIVNNPTFDNYIKLADRDYEDKNYENALGNYTEALKINPDAWQAIYRKGICETRTTTLGNFNIEASVNGTKNALKIYETEETDKNKIAQLKVKMAEDLQGIASDYWGFAFNHYQEYWKLENSANEMWGRLLRVRDCCLFVKENLLTDEVMELCPTCYGNEPISGLKLLIYKEIILCDAAIVPPRSYESGYGSYGPIYSTTIVNDTLRQKLIAEYNELVELIKKEEPEYDPPALNTSTSTGGCYVATAVYGSYDCPEVWTLRRFRDYKLDKNIFGKLFIKIYYAISPTIVKYFGKTKLFNKINKYILDKLVKKLNDEGYENTSYVDKY